MEPAGRPPSRPVSFPLSLRRARSAPRGFTCSRGTPDPYLGFDSGRKGSRFLLPAVRLPDRSRSAEPGEPLGCGAWRCPRGLVLLTWGEGVHRSQSVPRAGQGCAAIPPPEVFGYIPYPGKGSWTDTQTSPQEKATSSCTNPLGQLKITMKLQPHGISSF